MMYIRRRCATMKAGDVTGTLEMALEASGLDQANVVHRPRLLSDHGSSYISGDLADWLGDRHTAHVRGAPDLETALPTPMFPPTLFRGGGRNV